MKQEKSLVIGNKTFNSRLMIGTGKYETIEKATQSISNSAAEIVTVAVRRLNLKTIKQNNNLINNIDWTKHWLLPNTAGAKTAEEAIKLAFLGREFANQLGQVENQFLKLEVISDSKYLLPDPLGTVKAAEYLVKKGFTVLPYINADPMLAKHLEDIGCATVMPLGSPIGSGQGIKNLNNIQIIIENSTVPVIIDAGIGKPSEAALAMELGADAVLINTAIAQSNNPPLMAKAMSQAVIAGRNAYLAGKVNPTKFARSSSPVSGLNFLSQ